MTMLLSAGVTNALTQNVIYALPTPACFILAANACELSPTSATTGFVLVAATTTGMQTGAAFIRCTTGATVISVKRV